ncbi:MAG TPA: MFS transporter [Stellaceae bacterium]|nr:MFS transporter [Stellaceae bacterium]
MIGRRGRDGDNDARVLSAAGAGLDGLNLFVATIQTGFGPFIAVYLTTEGWTQTEIGIALSIGTITAMASQMPGGALVDAVSRKSRVAGFSVLAFAASALVFAVRPTPLFVYLAQALHGFASCTLGPAVVAMSLAVAGKAALGLRLGRNARYASIGNGVGAVVLGACGYYVSNRAVFLLTAAFTLLALTTLRPLSRIDARPSEREAPKATERPSIAGVLADPRLLIFAACTALFTLANAAMLPLASTALTKQAGSIANLLIAACVVLPQLVVALSSPLVGGVAETRGRRGVLIIGFLMLPLRGLLFAVVTSPPLVVAVQALDGIAAAAFGVMVPLVAADIAGRTGHFNFALGFIGFAIGVGSTVGTTLAGWIADRSGDPAAFVTLAAIGAGATLLVWRAMPETRPARDAVTIP